jgi:hypothetical protein
MKVVIERECGKYEALIGLGFSYGLTSHYNGDPICNDLLKRLEGLSYRLSSKDKGHNKFLESIVVWIDITASRYWWSQMDTYRIGVSKQSQSTMHTLMHKHLTQDSFERNIPQVTLDQLNKYIDEKYFDKLKNELPEGFLQRRMICTNYKVLRHIIDQRKNHKLGEWKIFIQSILRQTDEKYLNF